MTGRLSTLLLLFACSAPAVPADLRRAETLEHDGDDGGALAAYRTAADQCPRYAPRDCAAALFGAASTLERLGRRNEATQAYEAIPARLANDPEAAARAFVAGAGLRLDAGDERGAYESYWRIMLTYPDTQGATDALRLVVADGRKRNARQLYGALTGLYARLEDTGLADDLLWDLALMARDDLHDDAAALTAFDRLVREFPKSGYRDDALWESGKLARAHGDPQGALRRWRMLLATREEAFLMGSYHSVWLDDAQLEVGRVLRDDLHDPRAALEELRRVEKDYPESTLRDDALFEIAVTDEALGDARAVCAALADLARRFPDSKYNLERAPDAAKRLGCAMLPAPR